jgi:hypothetical protein
VGSVDRKVFAHGLRYEVPGIRTGVYHIYGVEDQRVVEEQEVRTPLFGLLEHLVHGCERDQHPARLRLGPSYLEPAVVPALGEGKGGYPLYGLCYVPYARHG